MGINIDFKLLPMKAHYFLYNAGTGCVQPYMPVFARQLGFSTFVVGTIYSILPILGLISKPLFGALADRYQRHKSMFIFFIILTVISFFTVQFISPISKTTELDYHCNDAVSDLKFCPSSLDHCAADAFLANAEKNNTNEYTFDLQCTVKDYWMWRFICKEWLNNTNCDPDESGLIHLSSIVKHEHIKKVKENDQDCLFFLTKSTYYTNKLIENSKSDPKPVLCPKNTTYPNHGSFKLNCTGRVNDDYVMNLVMEPSVNDENVTQYPQFWYLFVALAISWIGMAVVVSVGDAICFDLLGKRTERYGHQRLWGAVGWGIFSLLAGTLVDANSGYQPNKNYTVIFYLMAAALLPNTFVSSCLDFKPNKFSSNIIKDIGKLFKSARVVVFFMWCIAVGLCTSLVWNFLFWHLEDLADQNGDCSNQERMKTLQGLVQSTQTFGGELPFFFISGWFINKVGHINSMTLVLFTFGIRLTLYSVLTNPWWVLPIELTQGMTFGIFYAAMTMYANVVAPSGTAATLQGLVGAIFEGIGVSSGSFICGYLMKIYGGSATFRIFGVSAVCLSFVHFFVQKFLDTFAAKHGKNLAKMPDHLHTNSAPNVNNANNVRNAHADT